MELDRIIKKAQTNLQSLTNGEAGVLSYNRNDSIERCFTLREWKHINDLATLYEKERLRRAIDSILKLLDGQHNHMANHIYKTCIKDVQLIKDIATQEEYNKINNFVNNIWPDIELKMEYKKLNYNRKVQRVTDLK